MTFTASESPTTLVLLDPTSPDGESALRLLADDDDHITLLVLLSGPASDALRQSAGATGVDLSTAGWAYLDTVVPQVDVAPDRLLAMTAAGPSAAAEIADVAVTETIRRVLLPWTVDRTEPGLVGLLARCVSAPMHVAPSYADVA
jgi:hypothetical protein